MKSLFSLPLSLAPFSFLSFSPSPSLFLSPFLLGREEISLRKASSWSLLSHTYPDNDVFIPCCLNNNNHCCIIINVGINFTSPKNQSIHTQKMSTHDSNVIVTNCTTTTTVNYNSISLLIIRYYLLNLLSRYHHQHQTHKTGNYERDVIKFCLHGRHS